jgi:3-dehydroquinate synthase
VGAFWQPRLVWIDPETLKTLPEREWRTGFAEVIKYGVIKNRSFFEWLEKKVLAEPNFSKWAIKDVLKAIYISAQTKASVVSADERETPLKGGREILNLGHTSGHALEAAFGYRQLSHGEAISIGMVLAGRLAIRHKMWSAREQLRLMRILRQSGLPIELPRLSPKQRSVFWSALLKDKKNVNGQLRFVLPVRLGIATVASVKLGRNLL